MDYFIDKPELSLGLMYHILAMSCVFRLCFGVLRGEKGMVDFNLVCKSKIRQFAGTPKKK